MKTFIRLALKGFVAAAAFSIAGTSFAQNYPSRDMTFIVPYAPGGSTDPISRQFSTQLEKTLGASINVENKPGGSATIGTGAIVRSSPDGHTIGLGSNSSLTYQPLVNTGLAYKSPDDYQPIVKLVDLPAILTVRADAPWKNFDEFLADVKKNPGKIRASVSGLRTAPDMVVQQLNKVAGIKIATVPLTGGGGEAMVALLGGRVEANVGYGASTVGHEQAGKVRVLAVFKKGKYDLFPNATPIGDTYDATLPATYYVVGPKGMPKNVLDKLVDASIKAVQSDDFQKYAVSKGYVADAKGPDAVKAELVEYSQTFADLIKFLDQK